MSNFSTSGVITTLPSPISAAPQQGKPCYFWLGVGSCVPRLIRLQDSVISDISEQNQLICEGSIQYHYFWYNLSTCSSCPIRFQDYLIFNMFGKNQVISQFFCMEMIIKGSQHLRLPFFVGSGQVCFWPNQIIVLFDHHYLREESIDNFFHSFSCIFN